MQVPPWSTQFWASGRATDTSASESGVIVICLRMLPGGTSRRAMITVPPGHREGAVTQGHVAQGELLAEPQFREGRFSQYQRAPKRATDMWFYKTGLQAVPADNPP